MKLFAFITLIGLYGLLFCIAQDIALNIQNHPEGLKTFITVSIALLSPLAKEIVQLYSKLKIQSVKKYFQKFFKKKKTNRLKIPDEEV